MGALPEAVLLRVGAGPYEVVAECRKHPEDCDPRQQRRKVREEQGHLQEQEKSSGGPILAVDIDRCPTLPPEALVDEPTGPLEGNLAKKSPHFAMLVHFVHNCHILRNRSYPREWALFGSERDRKSSTEKKANHTSCYAPSSPPSS
jgi:hypothetical protein